MASLIQHIKYSNGKTNKKPLVFLGLILLACLAASFKGHRNPPKSALRSKHESFVLKPQPTVENLYVLYLSQAELKPLLDNAKDHHIVFQFYHDENNKFTLRAWPRAGKEFKGCTVILRETEEINGVITDKKVHFGNVNIANSEFNDLYNAVNVTKYASFYFKPIIPNYDPAKINHIVYTIYGDFSKVPSFDVDKIPPNAKMITTANPSPPKKAD